MTEPKSVIVVAADGKLKDVEALLRSDSDLTIEHVLETLGTITLFVSADKVVEKIATISKLPGVEAAEEGMDSFAI